MGRITTKAAAILDACPEDVYATIADYRQGHPRILPKENLYDLQVEQGGYGAGTVIRFRSRFLGIEQSLYQRVSEPEPGRVLVERDIESAQNEIVTFTVAPLEQGRKSHVEISMTMNTSSGFKGLVEGAVVPTLFPPVLRKELRLLEGVAQERKATSTA
jgi:hypothetical protein